MENETAFVSQAGGNSPSVAKSLAIVEIVAVFASATILVVIGRRYAAGNLIAIQLVTFFANLVMLALVWLGLRCRGQGVKHFGVGLTIGSGRSLAMGFLKSLAALAIGSTGFVLGSIVMANITGIPGQADVSGYNFLRGNLPLMLASLAGIYFVSSFGEEFVYRGFLMTRVEELLGRGRGATVAAVVVSAVLFGLAHFSWGIFGIVQTAFMGLGFSLSFLLFKRNLWILVAAHAYMDTALIVPLYFG